jgi:nicotinamide/nicotinate riboside kinase
LNKQVEVAVDPEVQAQYKRRFENVENVLWCIVDGFVLYWDQVGGPKAELMQPVADMLDVKLFLRTPHDLLRERREARRVYVLDCELSCRISLTTAGESWEDPPGYFDKIVYPAYIKAHQHMFDDVETGELNPEWSDVTVLGSGDMTSTFRESCERILAV